MSDRQDTPDQKPQDLWSYLWGYEPPKVEEEDQQRRGEER